MEPSTTTTTALAAKLGEKEVEEMKEVPLGCRFGAFFHSTLCSIDMLTNRCSPTLTLHFCHSAIAHWQFLTTNGS